MTVSEVASKQAELVTRLRSPQLRLGDITFRVNQSKFDQRWLKVMLHQELATAKAVSEDLPEHVKL